MNNPRLKGLVVPLLTPYHPDGAINETELNRLINHLISTGVDAVMVAGTTGEGPLLSLDERRCLAEAAVKSAAGRLPVAVQIGTAATHESIMLARHAVACGANAVSIICPYFFGLPEQALVKHFCEVAGALPQDFPVYLYNIPQRSGNNISASVSEAVAKRCPNVVGEKDSSGDLNLLALKCRIRESNFDVLVGNDALVLPALVSGAIGAVAGNANVFPELFVSLMRAFCQGDLVSAQQAQLQIRVVTETLQANISLFKALLRTKGFNPGDVRSPLQQASPSSIEESLSRLRQVGLLSN